MSKENRATPPQKAAPTFSALKRVSRFKLPLGRCRGTGGCRSYTVGLLRCCGPLRCPGHISCKRGNMTNSLFWLLQLFLATGSPACERRRESLTQSMPISFFARRTLRDTLMSRGKNFKNLLMPLFLMGCFPVDFQEVKRPLRTKSVKRPIKVGKRPINEGKRPLRPWCWSAFQSAA